MTTTLWRNAKLATLERAIADTTSEMFVPVLTRWLTEEYVDEALVRGVAQDTEVAVEAADIQLELLTDGLARLRTSGQQPQQSAQALTALQRDRGPERRRGRGRPAGGG